VPSTRALGCIIQKSVTLIYPKKTMISKNGAN